MSTTLLYTTDENKISRESTATSEKQSDKTHPITELNILLHRLQQVDTTNQCVCKQINKKCSCLNENIFKFWAHVLQHCHIDRIIGPHTVSPLHISVKQDHHSATTQEEMSGSLMGITESILIHPTKK